jgi:hypothetical protein
MICPVAVVVVEAVVVVPVTGSVVRVVVVVCCAKATLVVSAQAVPAANILANLVCFIFLPLLWLNRCPLPCK